MSGESGLDIRREIRAGRFRAPTSGLGAGLVQANIAIVPAAYADDFAAFCTANPRACALLYRSSPGDHRLAALGEDIDIRSDLPRYQLHRAGADTEEITDIHCHWRDDLVTFALGCSFSFEEALDREGLEVRNISEGCNVPMYRTQQACKASGPFHARLVVSMRPFMPTELPQVQQVCERYPLVHGAPVFAGDPAALGITDIDKPDFGDPVPLRQGEVPAFWACGVTAIEALRNAGLDFCITHSPGHMLVTDRLNTSLAGIPAAGDLDWSPL
ncbi:putative hydro-lyase [Microbulbifer sp. YPW16]|uniref:putative hydro-lyase n=1 Tax=Microbulbifer sp. YPW16 TaxID=2904242 RepID=UPI001E494FF2|nr:putative hydro-lyase [Microbulbifer sp. YPW16]UHQ55387.1 putative hydro-lyase [Microbulbifer sp. YPW16]